MTDEEFAKRIAPAIDATNPVTRNFALEIAQGAPGSFNAGQICLIWDRLKRDFSYVNDPRKFELVARASETIKAGLAGDCDDVATLTAALIEAMGGFARVIVAYSAFAGHAYAECFLGGGEWVRDVILPVVRGHYPGMEALHCHVDAVGNYWMNMDILYRARYAGGVFYAASWETAFYRDGLYESIS